MCCEFHIKRFRFCSALICGYNHWATVDICHHVLSFLNRNIIEWWTHWISIRIQTVSFSSYIEIKLKWSSLITGSPSVKMSSKTIFWEHVVLNFFDFSPKYKNGNIYWIFSGHYRLSKICKLYDIFLPLKV